MSNTRKFIDHVINEDGNMARSSISESINKKVASFLESKKIELAGGSLVSEESSCGDMDDLKSKMKKTKKKIKKLKEEIAILEDYLELTLTEGYSCGDDDADPDDVKDEIDDKKKKLKKSKKKMKKLKEALSLFESEEDEDEIDEDGDWTDESSEESEDE